MRSKKIQIPEKKLKKKISNGNFASDEIVNKLLKDCIYDLKDKDRIIFDGYPRTIDQSKNLDNILKEFNQKNRFSYIPSCF